MSAPVDRPPLGGRKLLDVGDSVSEITCGHDRAVAVDHPPPAVRLDMDPHASDRDADGYLAVRFLNDGVTCLASPAVWNMLYAWSWDRAAYPDLEREARKAGG